MESSSKAPPPPRRGITAYWLASIRNMVRGATLEGVSEDQIYDAVVQAIQEAHEQQRDHA